MGIEWVDMFCVMFILGVIILFVCVMALHYAWMDVFLYINLLFSLVGKNGRNSVIMDTVKRTS